ncbi:phage tail protein [Pseudomonas sp. FW300-N2A2]|uniref:phage tail protein n=1 Tax=Pseudomonas sp. FW300-N2A2 TaxID=2751316 RepID=UPI001A91A8F7|nr:phage tail protein [Pseudomonas sp. FW300-N2A2]
MADYYTLLTNAGIAYETACKAAGVPIKLSQISVGDGGGAVYNPAATATALKREVWRGPLNALFQDEKNPSWLLAEVTIPPEEGGWYVREAGLWTDTGILYAIVKYPESFKPVLATSGSGKEFYIRSIFETSNASLVTLLIDDTVVKATRAWVMGYLADELAKLDGKQSVRVATTENIVLSGAQQIDGVAVLSGQRVLVTAQTLAKDNGLYVAANGAWVRATDANTSAKVTPGLTVMVEEGTANGDSLWHLVTNGPITLGTTALSFEMLAGRTGIQAGTYKSLTVDKYGRATAGANPETLAGFGIKDTYTKPEIEALIAQASALPVGAVVAFPKTAVPAGFLEIDGSVQSIATYPDLFAYLGTSFNQGNEGTGNFRLPESRGEFLRGWDHGRGVDAGRSIGSWQKGTFHSVGAGPIADVIADYDNTSAAPGASLAHKNFGLDDCLLSDYPTAMMSVQNPTAIVTPTRNDASYGVTRPRNLAVMWCIKAWNAPINQGQVDVGELVKEVQKLKAAVPVGALVPFPSGTVPPGYLEADNSLFVDSVYPELAAYLDKKYNVAGDPVGSTRLPETRGEFLRGWDHGRGIDSGRAIGSWQKGTMGVADTTGSADGLVMAGLGGVAASPISTYGLDSIAVSDYPSQVVVTGSGVVTGALTGVFAGSTRPRNLAVMWCIKAWNAPVNQGTIDVAGLAAQVGGLEARPRGVGDGQTWQNVTASRVSGTVYTNTTGRPIQVQVSIQTGSITATCGGVTIVTTGFHAAFVVPVGTTYSVTLSSPVNAVWSELRP